MKKFYYLFPLLFLFLFPFSYFVYRLSQISFILPLSLTHSLTHSLFLYLLLSLILFLSLSLSFFLSLTLSLSFSVKINGYYRGHFLNAFDSCEHSRCAVQKYDYDALQFWLFEFHNSVTTNIYREKIRQIYSNLDINDNEIIEKGENRINPDRYPTDITYPPLLFCPTCINSLENLKKKDDISTMNISVPRENNIKYNKENVLKNLKSSYWDLTWSLNSTVSSKLS